MTGDEKRAYRSDGEEDRRDWSPDLAWLLRQKIDLPAPIEGYVERPEVEARCALIHRRLTVLHAPGGFGKTALLGQRCREIRGEGLAVAWLSLADEDGPESLFTCLVLALERAGVECGGNGEEAAEGATATDTRAHSQVDRWIGPLIRALERHREPCVLALDEVERLQNAESVAVLNALMRYAPANLHVAMAYRERPPGLEVAALELEGRSETVTAEDIRFSASDISRFFGRRLSRRKLAELVPNSGGWPIALRIFRNAERNGAAISGPGGGDLVADWIETRLWRNVSDDDREFMLDIALLDRLEPDLVEEAVGVSNAGRRLASVEALTGLFSTAGRGGPTMHMLPLVKDHCEKRRFEETPDRFRTLHRRIAEALFHRGRAVEALRHAAEAGDRELLGRLAESAGGVRLWLEEGPEALRAVDRLLTEDVLSQHPRLALLHCAALAVSGEIAAARRIFHRTAARTEGFTRDREGGDDEALRIDRLLVHGLIEMCGCSPLGTPTIGLLRSAVAAAEAPDVAPVFRGAFSLGICMMQNRRTDFDAAVEWAERAREELGPGSPHLAHVDFQLGSVAMARGRADRAKGHYDRALRAARTSRSHDPGAVLLGQVLSAELELECSVSPTGIEELPLSPRQLGECGAWLDIYAAYAEVGTELAFERDGAAPALAAIDRMREHARRTERERLARFLSALRASVLVASGEVGEAERRWRVTRLPEDAAACIDLEKQSWREAETIACARLRLLAALGDFDAARELYRALLVAAEEQELVRMRMRGLALSMALESRAGDDDRARIHLEAYLRLVSDSGYVRPLSRERTAALPLLDEIAWARLPDGNATKLAARLREAMSSCSDVSKTPEYTPLTERELEVLLRLEQQRDSEIAEALNLSYDGLRSRIRQIFAKLGARGRLDAVHRARAQGILPPRDDAYATGP